MKLPEFITQSVWIEGYVVLMFRKMEVSQRERIRFRFNLEKDALQIDRTVSMDVHISGHVKVCFFEWFDGELVFSYQWPQAVAVGNTVILQVPNDARQA